MAGHNCCEALWLYALRLRGGNCIFQGYSRCENVCEIISLKNAMMNRVSLGVIGDVPSPC